MANKIQVRRGAKSKLPVLNEGEFGLCTDTKEVYIGTSGGNILLPTGGGGGKKLIATFTASGTFNIADYGLKIGDKIDIYEVGAGGGGGGGQRQNTAVVVVAAEVIVYL